MRCEVFGPVVSVTRFMLCSGMPHGGMKMSGYGKALSLYALEDYRVPRQIMVKL